MIRTALEFIRDELNTYVQKKDSLNFGGKDIVVLSSLVNPDGSVAFETSLAGNNENHKLIVTLVHAEEERTADIQTYQIRNAEQRIQQVNPPVHLNLYVLFSAFSNEYRSALRNLSYIASFFQVNNFFDAERFPHLNQKADEDKPWQRLERLTARLHNMNFEQVNNLWASLGAKYMPSLIYKFSLLTIRDMEPGMEAPPIREITITES